MVVLSLVWSMKLNKLSLSARARKQRDGEMASPWRPWEWGIASEVEGQTFFCICNMIIMKKPHGRGVAAQKLAAGCEVI